VDYFSKVLDVMVTPQKQNKKPEEAMPIKKEAKTCANDTMA
jgi:hypothetical protein